MSYKPGPTVVTKSGRTSWFTASGYTDTYTVHVDFQNINAQTAFMLIDLSDTTNWGHSQTGYINLEHLFIEVDPDATFLGEIKLGFLNNVDATDGDFCQIIDIDMAKKSDLILHSLEFGSHGMDLEGSHHFGPILANNTLFQTDVNLEGPDGTTSYPSGDGDLALLVERSAGSVDVSITLGYETAT